jgi:hypothetical protein
LCGLISQTSAEKPPKNGGMRKANCLVSTGGGEAAAPIAQTFFYKNYTSKAVRYSDELKLRTVFKQFNSNENLKFLSETLSRFSP